MTTQSRAVSLRQSLATLDKLVPCLVAYFLKTNLAVIIWSLNVDLCQLCMQNLQ